MVALMEQYNVMIEEEDLLYKQIEACQECTDVILDHISDKAESLHIPTTETILTAIDVIKMDLHRELLHLRIEKSIISREISLLKEEERERSLGAGVTADEAVKL